MKIIDLLNKIANGDEVPKKIIYCTFTYWYDEVEKDYYRYVAKDLDDEDIEYLLESCFASDILNDEVEVCSTGLTVKEAEENLCKFSEALHKEANKKREKEDEILDNLEEEKKIPEIIHWHEENGVGNDDDAFYVDVNDKSQYVDSEYDSWEMTVILKINEIIDYLKSKGE